MPPKDFKTGSAQYNVLSLRVDDALKAEILRRIGRKSISKYLKELIERDLCGL
jgi:hypothetical protein